MSKIFVFSTVSSYSVIIFDCFIGFKTTFMSLLFRFFTVFDELGVISAFFEKIAYSVF